MVPLSGDGRGLFFLWQKATKKDFELGEVVDLREVERSWDTGLGR